MADVIITFSVSGEGNLPTMPTTTITIPYNSGDTSAASVTVTLNSTGDPGLVNVVATADNLESAKTDVIFLGPPVAISISANPNQMYVDDLGGSAITVSLLDKNGFNTNPTDGPITISLTLTNNDTGGTLEVPFSWSFPISDLEGIIKETKFSGQSSTGTAIITAIASEVELSAVSVTINVISALVPDHIKLTATPQYVEADGSELSTITAVVYDISGNIVTNYPGTITFTKEGVGNISGSDTTTTTNGVATVKLSSDTSGTATVTVSSSDSLPYEPADGVVVEFYEETTLTLVDNTTQYEDTENKVIAFNVKVTGENIVVDAMKIIWTNSHPNQKLSNITIEDEEVYSKQTASGITVVIIETTLSPEENSTIQLTFIQDMTDKLPFSIYFNSGLDQYEITLVEDDF